MKGKFKRTPRYYDGTGVTSRQLKDLIPYVLRKVQGAYGTRSEQVLAAWPEIIGERLAKMSCAYSFYDGVLKVRVKNSTLLSLLQQHDKSRILSQLRRRFPGVEIKTILFRIG
ncbi:MAG: hypothetical protein K940chlam3_00946 [Chlamydiae bacterium]|nr:hypothetical protein [Chlamydiota bacterium]